MRKGVRSISRSRPGARRSGFRFGSGLDPAGLRGDHPSFDGVHPLLQAIHPRLEGVHPLLQALEASVYLVEAFINTLELRRQEVDEFAVLVGRHGF